VQTATLSAADPFDAGPYARLQAALGRGHLWVARAGPRALAVAAIAWLPLLVLAALQGLALRDRPHESLLLDLTAYARYVVAAPVLLLAEPFCLPRLAMIARHFRDAGLVAEADVPRYESLISSTRALLENRRAEIVLVLVAYAAALASARTVEPTTVSTWMAPIVDGQRGISLAGWWRLLVSQPLFLLLVGAWLWRTAVWSRFLWKVARLDLRLVPAHPDLAGGLRFVATSLQAFVPVAFAISAASAGRVAEGILFDGRSLQSYQWVVISVAIFIAALFVGPLLVFCRMLLRVQIAGTFLYGELAGAVGQRLEQRWFARMPKIDSEALSVQDFSATTDLYSIAANVRAMRLTPFDLWAVLPLLGAALLPFLPLVFTVVSPKEILQFAAKLVL
jgi:hypothetical protein